MTSNDVRLGFTDLKRFLRHRHPMIMIDRVERAVPGSYLRGRSVVSGGSDSINGHFPERAIYPGSNLIQAFSQGSIILLQLSSSMLEAEEMTVVGGVQARFFSMAVPGDVLTLEVNLDHVRSNAFFFSGIITSERARVARLKLSLVRLSVDGLSEQSWW